MAKPLSGSGVYAEVKWGIRWLTYSGQHDFVVAEDDKLLVASQEILNIVLHSLQFCLKKRNHSIQSRNMERFGYCASVFDSTLMN
jgi:hypothetical protein